MAGRIRDRDIKRRRQSVTDGKIIKKKQLIPAVALAMLEGNK